VKSKDLVAEELEPQISGPVVLERRATTVRLVSIHFDDQAVLGPGKIHDELADAGVHIRLGKPVATSEGEELRFELAPRRVWLQGLVDRQLEELGLAECRGELRLGKNTPEVLERARRRRDGDAETTSDVTRHQRSGAVDDDAVTPSPAGFARHRDVDIGVNTGWGRRATGSEHSPELARAGVAQHGPWSTSKDRSHPSPGLAHPWVPHSEHRTMKSVDPSRLDAAGEALPADAQALQLGQRNHAVLASGDMGDGRIPTGVGEFLTHVRE
jgi:hypothetical protein